jgi:hypothetical protein
MYTLESYAAALRSLEAFAWAGVNCLHGVPLAQDCFECEPVLNHDPELEGC